MADTSDDEDWDALFDNPPDVPPPPEVTPDLFARWRAPRFGRMNPTPTDNAVWQWLINSGNSAYRAATYFPGVAAKGPCWSFARFGQSKTALPDGRTVMIGGEHEDSYDADFCIYNDVVVKNTDGTFAVYCYPEDVFPPTDFHTATLDGNRIVIVGAFGYPAQRKPGTTPVYVLDTGTLAIARRECIGDAPGWLHKHSAVYDAADNAIVMSGGLIDTGDDERNLIENIDDWKLHLGNWRWERLTRRQWPRWDIRREDMTMNALFDLRSLMFWNRTRERNSAEEALARVREELGFEPDLDILAALYAPPVPHVAIPEADGDDYGVHRIAVNGVTVRYNETSFHVRLTVEGDLPAATLAALTGDLMSKLSALEGKRYELIRL